MVKGGDEEGVGAAVAQQVFKALFEVGAEGVFDDEAGDAVGGVDDAVSFAFAADGVWGLLGGV